MSPERKLCASLHGKWPRAPVPCLFGTGPLMALTSVFRARITCARVVICNLLSIVCLALKICTASSRSSPVTTCRRPSRLVRCRGHLAGGNHRCLDRRSVVQWHRRASMGLEDKTKASACDPLMPPRSLWGDGCLDVVRVIGVWKQPPERWCWRQSGARTGTASSPAAEAPQGGAGLCISVDHSSTGRPVRIARSMRSAARCTPPAR
jgi:hypothetical protein